MTISPDGASVYVAAEESGAIAVFDRAADGALTQKAGLDACVSESGSGPCADGKALTGAHGLARTADGTSVYAVSKDGVAVFDRHVDGTLAQKLDEAGVRLGDGRRRYLRVRPGADRSRRDRREPRRQRRLRGGRLPSAGACARCS